MIRTTYLCLALASAVASGAAKSDAVETKGSQSSEPIERDFIWFRVERMVSDFNAWVANPYQWQLERWHRRLDLLEAMQFDSRRNQAVFPSNLESEHLELIATLKKEDPIWVLEEDLAAQIKALAAKRSGKPDEDKLHDLKDILASIAGCGFLVTSREEGGKLAEKLRKCMAKHDVKGAAQLSAKYSQTH